MNTESPCYEIHPDDLERLATSKTCGLMVRILPDVIWPEQDNITLTVTHCGVTSQIDKYGEAL